jgi:uncharacterized protein DUF3168
MIIEGIYKLLTADSGVSTLLGTSRSDGTNGLFPVIAPKEVTLPYAVFEQTGNDNSNMTMEGLNRRQEGRFRFHCYAADYKTARALAQAIKKAFAAFNGTLGDPDATPVGDVTPAFEADGPIDTETRATIYNRIIDFYVWYVDTTN